MAMQNVQKLQPLTSLISSPFVSCSFGGAEFGVMSSYNQVTMTRNARYVTDLTVTKKASGQVNTYLLNLVYVVEPGADPNYVDLVISQNPDRSIKFSYGDTSQPEYSFVEERALISNIAPSINFTNSAISYTISATSSVALSYAIKRSYAERNDKPSTVIVEVLNDKSNGLLELFTGMRDTTWVEQQGFIPTNDKTVHIKEQKDISPLDYLRYLLSCMQASDGSFFAMIIHDEPRNVNGPYFEIVNSNLHQGKGNHYSVDIDVGYPGDTPVFSFTPSQNTSLALITQLQEKIDKSRVVNINEEGVAEKADTVSLAIQNGKASESIRQWWNSMTSFPISATLQTRGLIKPSILCDYIHINVLFFGQRYNYSGYYMVTGQVDKISSTGYTTDLTLVRVEGDKLEEGQGV